ncbi:N-acetyl-gamma-glutamyl-phosphate reductase [Bacillus sp. CGMCC 1.16607]|uniref:N-acetyl-gamma-glutamyl-phosphate reductase n=1 Tax=Bacillus sp. CGMCC 1.16607 TaxID=3351842 RepID=UPI00362E8490
MKAAIIGGTGYSSIELIRLLQKHPYVEVTSIISNSQAGSSLHMTYPHVTNIIDQSLQSLNIQELCKEVELVFLATPSGISQEIAPEIIETGVKCIDLSGDFRLKSAESYESWYKHSAAEEKYLHQAVYGLSEIYEEKIKAASLIANPGCYPTASLLGLMPVIKNNLVDSKSIIIDAKSGVSGAGRSVSLNTHFAEVNENLKAYKIGQHQHIPEIEQTIEDETGQLSPITFTTHLVPMTRGIMCTIHVNLIESLNTSDIHHLYNEFYRIHPFVRIRSVGDFPATKEVYGSNFCDIGLYVDERTRRLTIISVIDNLVKGASGQAIQNMNILNGWDVRTGLLEIPVYP